MAGSGEELKENEVSEASFSVDTVISYLKLGVALQPGGLVIDTAHDSAS